MSNAPQGKLNFSVTKVDNTVGLELVGTLDSLENLPSESYGRDLVHSSGTIQGYLSVINRDNFTARFSSQQSKGVEILEGETYLLLDGYWGERVDLVLNPKYQWKPLHFEPSESIIIRHKDSYVSAKPETSTDTSEHEKGVWDHEHCAICWATIDEQQSKAYTCEQDYWVCPTCFENYISKRNIEVWL